MYAIMVFIKSLFLCEIALARYVRLAASKKKKSSLSLRDQEEKQSDIVMVAYSVYVFIVVAI